MRTHPPRRRHPPPRGAPPRPARRLLHLRLPPHPPRVVVRAGPKRRRDLPGRVLTGSPAHRRGGALSRSGPSARIRVEAGSVRRGSTIPTATYAFDASTGLPAATTADSVTLTTGYDSWGQVTSQADADGNTAATTYDIDGRIATVNDARARTPTPTLTTVVRGSIVAC
nr:RHS repeat domain-containing protein [Frankia alni]